MIIRKQFTRKKIANVWTVLWHKNIIQTNVEAIQIKYIKLRYFLKKILEIREINIQQIEVSLERTNQLIKTLRKYKRTFY